MAQFADVRECAASRASMDVLLGGLSELITAHPKGCLAPVKPKMLLPEVTDGKYWRGGVLKFNDLERLSAKPSSKPRWTDRETRDG